MALFEDFETKGTSKALAELVRNSLRLGSTTLDQKLRFRNLGNTLLHFTVDFGLQTEVSKLLAAGARTDIRNRQGQLPMDLALERGNQKILHMLCQRDNYRKRIEKVRTASMGVGLNFNSIFEEKLLGLQLSNIYETYLDWNDSERCFHLGVRNSGAMLSYYNALMICCFQALMDNLERDELHYNHVVNTLSKRKQSSIHSLRKLHEFLRKKEHDYCLNIWSKMEYERLER